MERSDEDGAKVARAVASVYAYYKTDLSEPALNVWIDCMAQFPANDVVRALNAHMMDPDRGSFIPRASDVVRILQGNTTDRASAAWTQVVAAISDVGGYRNVAFDDPCTHAAIKDCGGWSELCGTETELLTTVVAKRFADGYRSAMRMGATLDYPRILSGRGSPDEVYVARGLKPPPVVLIGDKTKAQAVMEGKALMNDAAQRVIAMSKAALVQQ